MAAPTTSSHFWAKPTRGVAVRYLHVESASLAYSDKIRVGLIWQSGDWDESRSIRFPTVAALAGVPDVEWHVLQSDALRAGWDGKFGIVSGGDNPLDDARVMHGLDLVISVDTMTAHLAGALGRKTWTLLPFEADWRWMKDREDCPWYPTMRLFRQQKKGDWSRLIEEVKNKLTKTVALNRRPSEDVHPDLSTELA